MRNTTFIILVAISISDSMTGLVTLPTYIRVFKDPDILEGDTEGMSPIMYYLTEELCDGFMISKFFLSKSFHTVSVWLTLFLGLQRFLTVYNPFVSVSRLFKTKTVIIVCVSIFISAPLLHMYHLYHDESSGDYCGWKIYRDKDSCGPDCVYLWCLLMFGHLLPAIFLTIFTVLFVHNLRQSLHSLRTTGSCYTRRSTRTYANRERENRRISIIVTAIVIVFLIPEVPYCGFLLYNLIAVHSNDTSNLKFNRAIHAAYEILLVLSFNANFYLYTFFNERFRTMLLEIIIAPVYNATCGKICACFGRTLHRISIASINRAGSGIVLRMKSIKGQRSSGTSENKPSK